MKYPIYGQAPGVSIRDTEKDNLHICWSEEDGFMLLFTPDMLNTNNHYHVELNQIQASTLSDFLSKYLREIQRNGDSINLVSPKQDQDPSA